MRTETICLGFCLHVLWVQSAIAEDRMIEISNMSGEVVTSITVVTKTENAEPTELLLTALAADDSAVVTLPIESDACVFDMTITFASSRLVSQTDRDLCQTDALIVE